MVIDEKLMSNCIYVIVEFAVLKNDVFQYADMWLDWLSEKLTGFASHLHGQCKAGKFPCTPIDLNPEEVVGQDQFRNLGGGSLLLRN
jgi:hypothetical protein